MKIFFYACFFASLSCYAQGTVWDDPNFECESSRKKAKKEVADGVIYFTMPLGFGSYMSKDRKELRCEKELRKLCDSHGLIFSYEAYADIVAKNQRQGCFGEYMDSIIERKYGKNFKRQLLHEADSIFSVSSDNIPFYHCDVRPHRTDGNDEMKLMLEIDSTFSNYFQVSKPDEESVMYISFLLDKQDQASGYGMGFLHNSEKFDKAVVEAMYQLALKELKSIDDWHTGTILGRKMNTRTHVKVYFTENGNNLEFRKQDGN